MPRIPSHHEKDLQLVKELVDLRHPDIRICVSNRPEVNIQFVLETLASYVVSLHPGGQTLRRSLSQMRTCGDGDRRTGNWNWSSIPCIKLMGCKASRSVFCSAVAHNTTQVSVGCLSTGYASALFSGNHSAGPERAPGSLDKTYERILLETRRGKT